MKFNTTIIMAILCLSINQLIYSQNNIQIGETFYPLNKEIITEENIILESQYKAGQTIQLRCQMPEGSLEFKVSRGKQVLEVKTSYDVSKIVEVYFNGGIVQRISINKDGSDLINEQMTSNLPPDFQENMEILESFIYYLSNSKNVALQVKPKPTESDNSKVLLIPYCVGYGATPVYAGGNCRGSGTGPCIDMGIDCECLMGNLLCVCVGWMYCYF